MITDDSDSTHRPTRHRPSRNALMATIQPEL